LGLAAAQPEAAKQTQKMAIRILMAATHHPATATTPQGKAIHHDWRKSAHESPRTPYGLAGKTFNLAGKPLKTGGSMGSIPKIHPTLFHTIPIGICEFGGFF